MSVRSIRQWQWIVISLLIGAAIGTLRQQAGADLEGQFGEFIRGQDRFERALLSDVQGRARFTDISVHARNVPNGAGGMRRAFLVSGSHFDGHFDQQEGKLLAQWRPAFFIAEVPYKPATDFNTLGRPDLARRFQSIHEPTVMDFLDCLAAARNTHYTYAWWLGLSTWQWMLGCFILIGVIWPACVNLMLYGSIRRPPEEKGIDLSKVKLPTPAVATPALDQQGLDRLLALEAEMESQLAGATVAQAESSAPPVTAARRFEAGPLEALAVQTAEEQAAYGAKKEDYYPTRLRAPETPGHQE